MTDKLSDFIIVEDNAIPIDLCDLIIKEYKDDNSWVNTTTKSGLSRNVRRCDAINMSHVDIIAKNQDVRKEIDSRLYECTKDLLNRYSSRFRHILPSGDSGYVILRYQEGEFYTQHTDHFLEVPRMVSVSFALNEDYEGGEFCFFDRQIKHRIPKGSALMFPSNFMYPHEILPVTKGVRYSIITWIV